MDSAERKLTAIRPLLPDDGPMPQPPPSETAEVERLLALSFLIETSDVRKFMQRVAEATRSLLLGGASVHMSQFCTLQIVPLKVGNDAIATAPRGALMERLAFRPSAPFLRELNSAKFRHPSHLVELADAMTGTPPYSQQLQRKASYRELLRAMGTILIMLLREGHAWHIPLVGRLTYRRSHSPMEVSSEKIMEMLGGVPFRRYVEPQLDPLYVQRALDLPRRPNGVQGEGLKAQLDSLVEAAPSLAPPGFLASPGARNERKGSAGRVTEKG